MTDELVMYIVARTELTMSPGKLAAQVGHGVQLAMRKAEKEGSSPLAAWESNDYPKVILGGTIRDFEKLSRDRALDGLMVSVFDNGRTEVPAGSMTVLAFVPMRKSLAKKWVGRLRLYKSSAATKEIEST